MTDAVDAATKNTLSKSVKPVISSEIYSPPPLPPEFTDTTARLAYLEWLGAMSKKLKGKKRPEMYIRKEFLQTVYFESHRAGIDTSTTLGLIESLSDFQKFSVLDNGARGYMAVNPEWAKKIGDGDESRLFHLLTNIRFGCVMLRHYLDKRGGDLKAALLDYIADSLSVPKTDPRASQLVERVVLASEHWR